MFTRRRLIAGGLGLAGAAALSACTGYAPATGSPSPASAPSAPPAGAADVTAVLNPQVTTIDLGGPQVRTWVYGDILPGREIRAKAGNRLRVQVENDLPTDTSVHWHGIRLHNAADGVPGVTQDPIAPSTSYTYDFVAPDPGTYFLHPHTGAQLDRGLYAPLIIDDPAEPGDYDHDWVLVLDDWTDGVGKSPDDILAGFKEQGGTIQGGMSGMGGMGGMGNSPLGDVGDINYPHYLINGRVPAAPMMLLAKPGQRARIRLINAASDTVFRCAVGDHVMTLTHTDGYAVQPKDARAVYLAPGERADLTVQLGDGVFPLVAAAEGKDGQGLILIRTGSGTAPDAMVHPRELDADPLLLASLMPADGARLDQRDPDQVQQVTLDGQMEPYAWGMNGKTFGSDNPIRVSPGARLRLQMVNQTMMAHPMHIHGHTWSLPGSGGLRKDTVLVLPMQTVTADLQADNPGKWAYHCHNIYHAEIGMMTTLQY